MESGKKKSIDSEPENLVLASWACHVELHFSLFNHKTETGHLSIHFSGIFLPTHVKLDACNEGEDNGRQDKEQNDTQGRLMRGERHRLRLELARLDGERREGVVGLPVECGEQKRIVAAV